MEKIIIASDRQNGRHPASKPLGVGLEIPNLWGEQVTDGTIHLVIRGKPSDLPITLHRLQVGRTQYQHTFVTKIQLEAGTSSHCSSLPWCGFGSMLIFDYMEELDHLLRQWCAENNFNYLTCYSAWPIFQACLEKPRNLDRVNTPANQP